MKLSPLTVKVLGTNNLMTLNGLKFPKFVFDSTINFEYDILWYFYFFFFFQYVYIKKVLEIYYF